MTPVAGLERLDGVLLDGLEFCRLAYETLDSIQAEPNGIAELRLLSTRRAKKLLEEILPIAVYVQSRYGAGLKLRVRWRGGNQRYDARVLCSGTKVARVGIPAIQHLEVTTAVHRNDHLAREHLQREGGSFGALGTTRDPKTGRTISKPVVRTYQDIEHELVGLVRRRIESKTRLSYPRNTTLVIRCVTTSLVHHDEWDRAVEWLRQDPHPRRFVEVVLVEQVGNRVTTSSTRDSRR